MKFFIKSCLLFLILLGVILIDVKKTSADLVAQKKQPNNSFSATTLSFMGVDSAKFSKLTWFFNIDGIKFNGYEVKSLKIKNEGNLVFNYSLKTIEKNSDKDFCKSLNIMVLQNWEVIYQGSLLDLNVNRKINTNNNDDLILNLSLDNSDPQLMEKTCNFDLEVKTWKNNPDEVEKGLFAKQTLSNTVRSGKW